MAAYLSPEWFELALADPAPATDNPLILEQQVRDTPYGSVRYQVVVDGGHAWIDRPTRSPDIIITLDYDTACAIARGQLSAQRALMEGRLRVKGSTKSLLDRPLVGIDPLPPDVRKNTTF